MFDKFNRRKFLTRSLLTGGALAGAWHTSSSPSQAAPSTLEKLNIAAIGTGNRAAADISGCRSQNIVAIADIDSNFLEAASNTYKDARTYVDFRDMLDKEQDKIDAVIVATADHTHAPAAAMAMRLGKHTYCEKPLTHTVFEARKLAELAAEKNLVTQMGTQIHAGDNYRRVVELVESGTIGSVREVHVWVGVNYAGAKFIKKPKPTSVNWDLWLGPNTEREYTEATINGQHETVHPYHWRWFWDFGSGGLGDFGCHYMDLPHWALKLKHPTSIKANGPAVDPQAATAGLTVEYDFPARGDLPPVKLTWYDGGKKPPILATLKDKKGNPLNWDSGQLFVGDRGTVVSDYGKYLLIPNSKGEKLQPPEPYIAKSIGHHNEWIEAIKASGPTTCNFDYSGALTESVLLGVVAYRCGESLIWDAENLKVTNSEVAQNMIHKEYRKGWSL